MTRLYGLCAGAAFSAMVALTAIPAQATVLTFDTVTTGAEAPGVWYVDRHAPAGFAVQNFMGDNRLALTIDGADQQSGTFYNTQGRKLDTNPATTQSVSVQMWIDSAMLGVSGRVGGFWSTGVDASSGISAYPIMEVKDGSIQGYNYNTGAWQSLLTPTADNWYTLSMYVDTAHNLVDYSIDNIVYESLAANSTLGLSNVMLQGYNQGSTFTEYFDNLNLNAPAATPLPAAFPLLASGLGAFGLLSWRRKKKTRAAA